jgi:hypothetical protein
MRLRSEAIKSSAAIPAAIERAVSPLGTAGKMPALRFCHKDHVGPAALGWADERISSNREPALCGKLMLPYVYLWLIPDDQRTSASME